MQNDVAKNCEFSKEELDGLKPVLEKCADAAASIVKEGTDRAMNKFNTKNKKNGEGKND